MSPRRATDAKGSATVVRGRWLFQAIPLVSLASFAGRKSGKYTMFGKRGGQFVEIRGRVIGARWERHNQCREPAKFQQRVSYLYTRIALPPSPFPLRLYNLPIHNYTQVPQTRTANFLLLWNSIWTLELADSIVKQCIPRGDDVKSWGWKTGARGEEEPSPVCGTMLNSGGV
jgi:hypothetical protein